MNEEDDGQVGCAIIVIAIFALLTLIVFFRSL